MREYIDIVDKHNNTITELYHGTTPESAARLTSDGWKPRGYGRGGNFGNPNYLYLTNSIDNARWFSEEKGHNTVVKVKNIPLSFLKVDPDDGTGENIEQELTSTFGLPGSVVLIRSLGPEHFEIIEE